MGTLWVDEIMQKWFWQATYELQTGLRHSLRVAQEGDTLKSVGTICRRVMEGNLPRIQFQASTAALVGFPASR